MHFNLYAEKFILANKKHFNETRFEAMNFIRQVTSQYENVPKYVSFSGTGNLTERRKNAGKNKKATPRFGARRCPRGLLAGTDNRI